MKWFGSLLLYMSIFLAIIGLIYQSVTQILFAIYLLLMVVGYALSGDIYRLYKRRD